MYIHLSHTFAVQVLFKMDEMGGGLMVDSDDFGTMKDGKLTVKLHK